MDPLYPASPTHLPPGLVDASPAYRRNAWLAVLGLLAFLALYLGLTTWFAYRAYWLLSHAYVARSFLGFAAGAVAAFVAVFLGKALFFLRTARDRSKLEITQSTHPELFAFVHRLADEARAPRPHRVFVSAQVNAAVFYDLSVLNLVVPSRKNLEIGLGLVNALTLSELKAVLAHEFGHFAQRSMAVGRWVYVGRQIASHVVAKRDALDRLLGGLSAFDLRVAWIGWSLSLVVWSLRAVTDSFFRLVDRAELALSREMELQADRVAVSLSGSDALVHALYKLPQADAAWDHVEAAALSGLGDGRRVPDLFTLHTRAMEQLRRVLGEARYGGVPKLPEARQAEHRVFSPTLALPPQMWSTHPPNHVREDHAKAQYVHAALDERPAWIVFGDAAIDLRHRVTDHLLGLARPLAETTAMNDEEALACLDARFDKAHLQPRYHGLYLARWVTRSSATVKDLYGPNPPDEAALVQALREGYPAWLADAVLRARELEQEKQQLQALATRSIDAVIRHRGRTLRRRELEDVATSVAREAAEAEATLAAFHRSVRTRAWAAATAWGQGWPEHLHGLLMLLHYAEHNEANVDDAMGHLANTWEVVTADGRVSARERRRVIRSATDLQRALASVWERRDHVVLPAAVAERMKLQRWAEALGDTFGFPPPNDDNIGACMDVVESWYGGYGRALHGLREATLVTLLEAEDQMTRCALERIDPGPAPEPARAPLHYATLPTGAERELQTRLGLWDRFVVAEGFAPGVLRFSVAAAVIGVVLGYGAKVGMPTVVIYNGLGRDVVVSVAGTNVEVGPLGRAELEFVGGDDVKVETHTADGELIESFAPGGVDNPLMTYTYSVAGASPLVEWTATYGARHEVPPRHLGARRWLVTRVDHLFEEPPSQISTRNHGETRTVISAVELDGDDSVEQVLGLVKGDAERNRMALVHARWDPLPVAKLWLLAVSDLDAAKAVVQARLPEAPGDVVLGRLEQDLASPDEKTEVCAHHEARARAEPDRIDALYLAIRCRPDGPEQDDAFVMAREAHPEHPWLGLAAAHAYFRRGDLDGSIAGFERARRELGRIAEPFANIEARVHRLAADSDAVDLSKIAASSIALQWLLRAEQGDAEQDGGQAYALLARGQLAEAVANATDGDHRARVLRLAAVSDHAPPELAEEAKVLHPERGLDRNTAIAALVLARQHGHDDTPFVAAVHEHFGARAETILRFADRDALLADLPAAEQALLRLSPVERGHAAVLGVLTLERKAPSHWRRFARLLLFAPERPYLADPSPE